MSLPKSLIVTRWRVAAACSRALLTNDSWVATVS